MEKIYAIYDGDTFVDVGTEKELREKHGLTKGTIRTYACKSKGKQKGRIVIVIDDNGDDD